MYMTGADGLGAKYLGEIEPLVVSLGGIVLLWFNVSIGEADPLAEVGQLDSSLLLLGVGVSCMFLGLKKEMVMLQKTMIPIITTRETTTTMIMTGILMKISDPGRMEPFK
jgi:hypothetical protein